MPQQPFQRPTRLEHVYQIEIDRLLRNYMQFPTTVTLGEINMRLAEFAHARNFFKAFGQKLAKRMITQVVNYNALSWRQAATKSSNGRIIYQMLKNELQAGGEVGLHVQQMLHQNANYISSVPEKVAQQLTKFIQEQQVKGLRADEIAKMIARKCRHLRRYEVQRIARTEVAKADTAITRARAQSIGLNWYQWLTSEDARVRLSHRKMNMVLVNWNDPPSPEMLIGEKSEGHYHAGNIWNCRCPAIPITSVSDISWPAKVYTNNSIRRLTKKQFVLISGLPKELAA
jgi:SPP1 gp7 family putative phage head morphogenesis protein